MRRIAGLVPVLLLVTACGARDTSRPAQAPETPAPATESAGAARARLRTVDLEGQPLSGMLPIATDRPNAFREPVHTGPPTDDEGRSAFTLSPGQTLYVRAWDPDLRYFANNYYEVQPAEGSKTPEMAVTMVPGATLSGELYIEEGRPLTDSEFRVMLIHPEEGPWWPDRGHTDAKGRFLFSAVPAGTYTLHIEAAGGRRAELSGVDLPPGGSAHLGSVLLQ